MHGTVKTKRTFIIEMSEKELEALVSMLGHGCQNGHINNGVPQEYAEQSSDLYCGFQSVLYDEG